MAKKPFISLESKDLDAYIKNMRKKDFNGMIRDQNAVVRQVAQDMRRTYKGFVPKSNRKSQTAKYGFKSGNLRKSVNIYRKRQRNNFVTEFSVGFKIHRYGELGALMRRGKRVTDGYYGAFVDAGVAGRQRGKPNKGQSKNAGFRERARRRVNLRMSMGISKRGMRVLQRRLDKDIITKK